MFYIYFSVKEISKMLNDTMSDINNYRKGLRKMFNIRSPLVPFKD